MPINWAARQARCIRQSKNVVFPLEGHDWFLGVGGDNLLWKHQNIPRERLRRLPFGKCGVRQNRMNESLVICPMKDDGTVTAIRQWGLRFDTPNALPAIF
eukprot:TRINITY_DN897_c1_g1_i1.p5 TRINITY_DN897_c1_g1~~TRINITY_DN897_c1_g1_i1.p5  ORF type:complete len:100 (-),score=3.29 TRINITY_DN897_c1_g1_i1:3196-3495(-)